MNLIYWDRQLFLWINSFVGKVPFFDNIIKLIVNEYFVPSSLALTLFYLWFAKSKRKEKNREAVPIAFFSVIFIALLLELTNELIVRSRPFTVLPTNLLFYKPTDPSFPSHAATVGFALATAIFLANRRVGIPALILASFYAFSRVYAGVHFPSDVVAGASIGILFPLLVSRWTSLIKFSTEAIRGIQKRLGLEFD